MHPSEEQLREVEQRLAQKQAEIEQHLKEIEEELRTAGTRIWERYRWWFVGGAALVGLWMGRRMMRRRRKALPVDALFRQYIRKVSEEVIRAVEAGEDVETAVARVLEEYPPLNIQVHAAPVASSGIGQTLALLVRPVLAQILVAELSRFFQRLNEES